MSGGKGEPGKSRGEPICSSLIVPEIISLHAILAGENREVKCLCCGMGLHWAVPALEPLLPESRQSATGLERSCLREDIQRERTSKEREWGEQVWEDISGEYEGLQEGKEPTERVGGPLPGVGGRRRSAYTTPSSIPSLVSCSAPHRGSGNPFPAQLVRRCDAKWKVSLPGGVPRGTTWDKSLGVLWDCQTFGARGSPVEASIPAPQQEGTTHSWLWDSKQWE